MPDPANPQSLNRYSYVLNNPLRYTDPTGMFSEEEIMAYLGVDTWEEVLAFFAAGGRLEGRWGWLETLRAAHLGDVVQFFSNYEGLWPAWLGADVMAEGEFVEQGGQLYIQSGETLTEASEAALLGNAFGVRCPSSPSGLMYFGPYYAETVYWHRRFNPGRVDWVDVGLGVLSASSDVGLAIAVQSAMTGNAVGALGGVLLYGFGQAAGIYGPIKTYSEWQRGEATTVDLTVELVTSVGGEIPVAGPPFDLFGIGYDLVPGFEVTP
jgi:hypothetical protein